MAEHVDTSASDDARDRSWRTFVQGLLIDVLVAVCLLVGTSLDGDVDWWLLLASVGRTALQTAVSYVYRMLKPPAV